MHNSMALPAVMTLTAEASSPSRVLDYSPDAMRRFRSSGADGKPPYYTSRWGRYNFISPRGNSATANSWSESYLQSQFSPDFGVLIIPSF